MLRKVFTARLEFDGDGLGEGGQAMMDREEVKRMLVGCLMREKGGATLNRLLYTYRALRGSDGQELCPGSNPGRSPPYPH